MSKSACLSFVAVLLLTAACAPLPQAAATATITPLPPAPAAAMPSPTMTVPAVSTAIEPSPPAQAPAPAASAASAAAEGWQTYTDEAGFSISYPPDWTLAPVETDPSQPLQSATLEGPEGVFEMQWGMGFGGACAAYTVVHAAQGQLTACHTLREDGSQLWSISGTPLAEGLFGGFAYTKDPSQASTDVLLAVLATLTFEAGGPTPAPTWTPGEVLVDNAGPDFWPRGDWYFLETDQEYGQDCYEALPGLTASAEVRPELPEAGPYEVFVWSCGNPHSMHASNGIIAVHRSTEEALPQQVALNYQVNPGVWQSLGTYNLEPGAFLNVKSVVAGNVVADAYRFVPRPGLVAEVVPTPLPSGPLVSNHPPSPEQQLTSGDLAARIGITDPWYQPVTMTYSQQSFDDCEAFPREGCSGTRDGFEATVAYEAITLTYRVSSDYQLVGIQGAEQLDPWMIGQEHPQRVFLAGPGGGRVVYYPNGSWRYLRYEWDGQPESDVPVTKDQAATLQRLAPKYSTLYIPASGDRITFYGLGQITAPTDEDRMALIAVSDALSALPR